MNTHEEKVMKVITEKLGFDPSRPETDDEQNTEENWACDDSQPNPFSKLTQSEKDFLEKYVFEPRLCKNLTNLSTRS